MKTALVVLVLLSENTNSYELSTLQILAQCQQLCNTNVDIDFMQRIVPRFVCFCKFSFM